MATKLFLAINPHRVYSTIKKTGRTLKTMQAAGLYIKLLTLEHL